MFPGPGGVTTVAAQKRLTLPIQSINHAATAVKAAAAFAVTNTATIPQLGFIHEDSAQSFVLDIGDLYRTSTTLPIAFEAARLHHERPAAQKIERLVRRLAGEHLRREAVIPLMIERIKKLFEG